VRAKHERHTMTADERFKAAASRFLQEPEGLTVDDLAVLKAMDEKLHDRAVKRRDETLAHAADVRHAKTLGQPAPKLNQTELIADNVIDLITLARSRPSARTYPRPGAAAEGSRRSRFRTRSAASRWRREPRRDWGPLMTRAVLEDRLDLLSEIDAIARDLDEIIQRYGPSEDCAEVWRRVEAARATVLQQLSASCAAIH